MSIVVLEPQKSIVTLGGSLRIQINTTVQIRARATSWAMQQAGWETLPTVTSQFSQAYCWSHDASDLAKHHCDAKRSQITCTTPAHDDQHGKVQSAGYLVARPTDIRRYSRHP